MVSESMRTFIYMLGFGLVMIALVVLFLKLFGVIESPTDVLISILIGSGVIAVGWNMKGEVSEVKGELRSMKEHIGEIVESKLSKLNRDIGKIEGKLDVLLSGRKRK